MRASTVMAFAGHSGNAPSACGPVNRPLPKRRRSGGARISDSYETSTAVVLRNAGPVSELSLLQRPDARPSSWWDRHDRTVRAHPRAAHQLRGPRLRSGHAGRVCQQHHQEHALGWHVRCLGAHGLHTWSLSSAPSFKPPTASFTEAKKGEITFHDVRRLALGRCPPPPPPP